MLASKSDATAPQPEDQDKSDRRIWPRVPAGQLTNINAKLSNGGELVLLDLSRGGARLQCDRRMLPNSSLSLRLVTPDSTFTIAGRVVRSRIVKLEQGGLGYDVAVAFNEPLHQVPAIPAGPVDSHDSPEPEPAPADVPSSDAAAPESAAPSVPGTPDPPASPDASQEAAVAADPDRRLSEDDVAANAAAVAEVLGSDSEDETWSNSMFHVTAVINGTGEQIRDLFEGNDW